MHVLKFGGTSMGDAAAISRVAGIVARAAAANRLAIVVSAMSGITDLLLLCGTTAARQETGWSAYLDQIVERHHAVIRLLLPDEQQQEQLLQVEDAAKELASLCAGISLLGECSLRTRDRLAAYGELLSSRLFTACLSARGIDASWADSRTLIRTNSNYTRARVDAATTMALVTGYFQQSRAAVTVLPGFIASDAEGNTTTLGRGGSDFSAALIGAALPDAVVEIWTDVPGMMTADPRLVKQARTISALSFQEAMELSHFGAKVLYPPSVQPLLARNRSFRIRNTFDPDAAGTLIESGIRPDQGIIRGITGISGIALISLEGSGMVGIPGISQRLFGALALRSINVILITQASSEHSICVGIEESLLEAACTAVQEEFRTELNTGSIDPLQCETGLSIVALVGDQMKSHPGISGRLFSELGRNGVNVRAIAQGSSERNISTVISSRDVRKAINVLHEAFFENSCKQVNLFIAGVGNVGGKLIDLIRRQQPWLQEHLRLQVRVVGLLNSRRMLVCEEGIDLEDWQPALQSAAVASLDGFVEQITALNLRNSVFVDVTSQEPVAATYGQLLQHSIPVVACNKIAASSSYVHYRTLKDLSRAFGAPWLFETNVGAGLPVIGTLGDLMNSGDTVHRIEAVLSGTLNFVFNNYDGSRSFAEVVREAQALGYTEPDPRLDLGGTDVARKILILAREAGVPLEMKSVHIESFMPASCMQGSIEDFYTEMERQEGHFRALLEEARAQGRRLKFVATFAQGEASVGLQAIGDQHDFYHLYGKDNVVRFFTQRYPEQPLVVKGAGSGAEVTASGIFADIIKTARS